MSTPTPGIVERLLQIRGTQFTPLENELVTEAAALLKELYEALKALRGNIGCASLARNPVGIKLRAQADKALSTYHGDKT